MSLTTHLVNFNFIGRCLLCNTGRLVREMLYPSSCQLLAAVRPMSGRKNCKKDEGGPRCSAKVLAKSTCVKQQKKKEKGDEMQFNFKAFWDNAECCPAECQDELPRFDDLYYHWSDKRKRYYQRTWSECPKLKMLPRKICECDEEDYPMPPIRRRAVEERPKTACSQSKNADTNLMNPKKKKTNSKCVKISMRNCRKGRNPPHCIIRPKPSNCKKVCTPYPSFSECKKSKPKPLRPSECRCGLEKPLCAAWAELIRKSGKE